MDEIYKSKPQITSDVIHNHNCFAYLLALKPFITNTVIKTLPELAIIQKLDKYDENFPYGDLYSSTISYLENNVAPLYSKINPLKISEFDPLFFAIYHNNNFILEQISPLIEQINLETRPLNLDISKKIVAHLSSKQRPRNHVSPETSNNLFNELSTLFSPNFKPQQGTNIPSLKNYSYKTTSEPIEYRFSTQSQRHNGDVRINPLFVRWLIINAKKATTEPPVNYIYFNNLGLDRTNTDIPGFAERQFTLALHNLERTTQLNLAVITLPASKGLMSARSYQNTESLLSYHAVFKELLNVAIGKGHESGISDLWISNKTQKNLFGTTGRTLIMKDLLAKSFKTLGIKPGDKLSVAKKQAVWFHFIKYELTDFILLTLKPNGYNFTCKDAIDRGAVSSAYYNLMKSLVLNKPLLRKEFENAIDSAATNVKARGMNFHRLILWNSLNEYVNANYAQLIKEGSNKAWLIYWRDMNCPHPRVHSLLKSRISQCIEQLNSLPIDQSNLKKVGLKMLLNIESQYNIQLSGQRLLLEIVSRTSELLTQPTKNSISLYKNLANEVQLKYHPYLYVIGGLMKVILGFILFPTSLGYSESLITKGWSTANSGFFAHQKQQLYEEILEFSSSYPNT